MLKIGLEVHVHPKTESKLFCHCKVGQDVNASICPICTAQPGTKPMAPNGEAIRKAVMLSEALGCKIKNEIMFLRKHYFYPDLPAGFQRTSTPIGVGGELAGVRIREVHLEEDAGRYDLKKKVVDYSRAGVPLVEIVTEPDMHSKEDVKRFLLTLSDVLDFLDFWKDETMRADVNISVNGGERVEVKEVSSIRGIMRVIEIESSSPSKERVTKHFDEIRQETRVAREKETEMDYRFIPDPDIPIVRVTSTGQRRFEEILEEIGEKVPMEIARTILVSGLYPAYKKMKTWMSPEEIAEWVPIILGELRYRKSDTRKFFPDKDFFTMVEKLRKGEITRFQAVSILRGILDRKPFIMESRKGVDLEKVINQVLEENKEAVEKYRKGKQGVIHYLIGAVMKKVGGSISPQAIEEGLKKKLEHKNKNKGI